MYIGLLSKMYIMLGDQKFEGNCKVEKSVPWWLIT